MCRMNSLQKIDTHLFFGEHIAVEVNGSGEVVLDDVEGGESHLIGDHEALIFFAVQSRFLDELLQQFL